MTGKAGAIVDTKRQSDREGEGSSEDLTQAERESLKAPVNCEQPALTDKLLRLYDAAKASEKLAWETHASASLQLQRAEARILKLEGLLDQDKVAMLGQLERWKAATGCATPEEWEVREALRGIGHTLGQVARDLAGDAEPGELSDMIDRAVAKHEEKKKR